MLQASIDFHFYGGSDHHARHLDVERGFFLETIITQTNKKIVSDFKTNWNGWRTRFYFPQLSIKVSKLSMYCTVTHDVKLKSTVDTLGQISWGNLRSRAPAADKTRKFKWSRSMKRRSREYVLSSHALSCSVCLGGTKGFVIWHSHHVHTCGEHTLSEYVAEECRCTHTQYMTQSLQGIISRFHETQSLEREKDWTCGWDMKPVMM